MVAPDISRIFHPSLIDSIARARDPDTDEIMALAERIWSEVNGAEKRTVWRDLPEDSLGRGRAIAAARLAFGLRPSATRRAMD